MITLSRPCVLALALPLTLLSATCNSPFSSGHRECICTDEFRLVRLAVVNEQGDLEPGITATITMPRTGKELPYGDSGFDDGVLTVITDRENDVIHPRSGDEVVVDGNKDTRTFHARFLITVDDCRCHIWRASGPDTVVVR